MFRPRPFTFEEGEGGIEENAPLDRERSEMTRHAHVLVFCADRTACFKSHSSPR